MRYVVATVRGLIERQHSSLAEQQPRLLRHALTEAEAEAWETGFPHLVFPTLVMEKIQSITEWDAHQQSVQQSESNLAFAA